MDKQKHWRKYQGGGSLDFGSFSIRFHWTIIDIGARLILGKDGNASVALTLVTLIIWF
jgi:hypothetical protein